MSLICFSDAMCIEWQGWYFTNGYPGTTVNDRSKKVSRVIVSALLERELSSDEFVCHRCNNKKCVNPLHLYLGDAKSNAFDRIMAGKTGLGRKRNEEVRRRISEGIKNAYAKREFPRVGNKNAKPNSGSFGHGRYRFCMEPGNKGKKKTIVNGRIKYVAEGE